METLDVTFTREALGKLMQLPDDAALMSVQQFTPNRVTFSIAVAGKLEIPEGKDEGDGPPIEITSVGETIETLRPKCCCKCEQGPQDQAAKD